MVVKVEPTSFLRTPGIVSPERFLWRDLESLVNMWAILLAKDFGMMVDRVENA